MLFIFTCILVILYLEDPHVDGRIIW